ncbi:GNAT family N-acetyltransferase [Vreelandella populi]|uniref:GNAT family N-acetyltransferase n=1 Tax=Vreelandella populi TaxID=2498858 RepID=UPI000F8CFA6C|nr:GNAT family N-acetyltransferase [Halomonas populi]RUR57571.1 N-acetyltransferase [Halomonas populi]
MSNGAEPIFSIQHEEGETRGRYLIQLDKGKAELTYSKAGDSLIIVDHTFVPGSMRRKSIGAALVRHAVEEARHAGKKITPLCSFVSAQFARHPEWNDVLNR